MSLTLLDLTEAKQSIKASTATSGLTSPAPWFQAALLGVRTASGKYVTYDTALRASAVLACLRILSEDAATLPLQLYRRDESGGTTPALDHPLYSLLKDVPNGDMTSVELREHMVIDLFTTGNFYNQVIRAGGEVQEIIPLHAASVVPKYNAQGALVFQYTPPNSGSSRDIPKDQVWRGNILSSYGIEGRSLILLAREAIGLLLAAEEQGARLFSNGQQTSLALTMDGEFQTDEQRKQFMQDFNEAYSGSHNFWKAMLLENGMKAEKVGLTAQESQYIESRKFQLQEIARIFRIPGVMLGLDDKTNTYASAEAFFDSYVKSCMLPLTVRIEQTITRDLLLPSERGRYFAKHNLGGLMRADTKSRYEAYGLAINAGWMNRNEAREMEDFDRAPGLDTFLVPLNTGRQSPDGDIIPPVQQTPAATMGQMQPDAPTAQIDKENPRLKALAQAVAERVARKEAKAGTFDATFVSEVLNVSAAKAEAYCAMRREGKISEAEAVNALVSLAMES